MSMPAVLGIMNFGQFRRTAKSLQSPRQANAFYKHLLQSRKIGTTINVGVNILRQFDKGAAEEFEKHVIHLKAYRELISYRAPSSGDSFPKAEVDVIEMCRLLAEIAQMQSELFEASILKHAEGNFSFLPESIQRICNMKIDGISFFDREDHYRLDYLRRKYPFPSNVRHIMSEGQVEDFFGSWCAEEEEEGNFSPDDNWRILFDVP